MNSNCFKFECQYKYDAGYHCEMRFNGCIVHSLGPTVTVEDKENLHVVLKYDAAKELTDGGCEKLFELLKYHGFDVDKEFDRYDHREDRQVEYVQQREWQS